MKSSDPPEATPALGKALPRAKAVPPVSEAVWRAVPGHPDHVTDGQNVKLRDDLPQQP